MNLAEEIEAALGLLPTAIDPLGGGCIGQVYALVLADGSRAVAKVDESPAPQLDVEAYMLRYLEQKSELPVPTVYHSTPRLLITAFLPGESRFSVGAQAHAAQLLATLHAVRSPRFGLERDTLIGSLPQPNPWYDSWLLFFREQRLLAMARVAEEAGRLPSALRARVERLASDLERWLEEPAHPSLLHGDVWTTNVLAVGDRITGFIDPAVYYGHPEIELAFTTLFGTFGEPFFARYQELRSLPPGFFEERRHIYNLYPLLVHVRLFGGTYVSSVEATLSRFGY